MEDTTKSIIKSILLVGALLATCIEGQHYPMEFLTAPPSVAGNFIQSGPGVVHDPTAPDPRHLAHPAVVANAAAEAQLPPQLMNDFYKDPRIAEGLARESWFGDKEFPVFNRQAEKIDRKEIAKIVDRIERRARRSLFYF